MSFIDMRQGRDGTWREQGDRREDPGEGSTWQTVTYYNNRVFIKILKLLLWITFLIGVMLYINVAWGPGYNLVFFFLMTALYAAVVLSPIPLVSAGLLGAFYAWLASSQSNPRDLSRGALQGLRALFDPILVGGIISIQIVTGFLATWSFAENPSAFLYVLAGGILVFLVFQKFKLGGGKWFAWGVTAYSAVIIVSALWSTVPEDFKNEWVPFYGASETQPGIRFVSNKTINIPLGGYDRFEASGWIKLVNQSDQQCMHPRPLIRHKYDKLSNGYVVREQSSGALIYTMSWSADGWTYTIDMAPGRVETIEVTTVPLGQPNCKPVRL